MRVRVGTSGYNFPEWKGTFYPAKFPEKQMLEYYAQRLGTVEINYTFYRMPNAKTVAGWDAATPAEFTFVLKAPQRITHIARLKDVDDPLRYFLETARKLGPKLGPILFQLPPNFKKDVGRLNDLLRNAALCVADTEEGHTPLVATADFGYMRLRDEGYTPQDLEQWAESVKTLGKGWQDGFVFFKHEESGIGPKLAQEFATLLASPDA